MILYVYQNGDTTNTECKENFEEQSFCQASCLLFAIWIECRERDWPCLPPVSHDLTGSTAVSTVSLCTPMHASHLQIFLIEMENMKKKYLQFASWQNHGWKFMENKNTISYRLHLLSCPLNFFSFYHVPHLQPFLPKEEVINLHFPPNKSSHLTKLWRRRCHLCITFWVSGPGWILDQLIYIEVSR